MEMDTEMQVDVQDEIDPRLDLASTLDPLEYMIMRVLSIHFQAVKRNAAEEIHGLVMLFLDTLLQTAHELAQLARRRQPAPQDIMAAIEQMGVGTCQDLTNETMTSERVQYRFESKPKPVPQELIVLRDEGPDERMKIEPWMPPLPALHSYARTPVLPIAQEKVLSTTTRQKPSAAATAHLKMVQGRRRNDALVVDSLKALNVKLGQADANREVVNWELARQDATVITERRKWFVT